MKRSFTKYPNNAVVASTMGVVYDAISKYLSDDAVYDTLKPYEKKILAKAANSIDYQVYLMGAVDALDLANVATSETFDKVVELMIENWDFGEQRRVAGR